MRIPLATYRLQFNRQFRFQDARALVPYLHQLGITDLYASPLLAARRGSPHGYDVTDPTRLNPELGTEADFNRLVSELQRHQMGLLLDIVPNHMAASSENRWWMDVLENGLASPYAPFFDIDWTPAPPAPKGKILLPILGSPPRTAVQNQEIRLEMVESGLFLRYHEHRLPLAPVSYHRLLSHGLRALERELGTEHPAFRELLGLIETAGRLPANEGGQPGTSLGKPRAAAVKGALWRAYNAHPALKEFLDRNLEHYHGGRGVPASFDLLDALLAEQFYQLAFWREGIHTINYRRFFDITDLICVRVEDRQVFDPTHARILQLAGQGQATGLRVDHVDGLYDPLGYLRRLQQELARATPAASGGMEFYLLVEKILSGEEALPADWPATGTTGYDFLNAVNAIFVDARGVETLDRIYARFIGRRVPFADVVYQKKKQVMESLFPGEMRALARAFGRLAEQDPQGRRFGEQQLARALREVTACLPVYRTYVRELKVPSRERAYIEGSIKEAKRRNSAEPGAAFDFLRRVLLLADASRLPTNQKQAWLGFVRRWQQFTGPIMAKGFEDTSLYAYNRLVSLNEVGGDPGASGIPMEKFHRWVRWRGQRWPFTLNATATHDTKRGEDVRARINVLSELPRAWEACLERWRRWNRGKKPLVAGRPVPDSNEEMLLYQTLLGAWPLREDELSGFCPRLQGCLVKAAREAKVNTSWLDPHADYEAALGRFVDAILTPSEDNSFREDFLRFQKVIAYYGAFNGLAQLLLKIAAPGVPDFYQGTELWDFRLVDPDNRRPVDFQERSRLLADLASKEPAGLLPLARELLEYWPDGRIKLYLTWKALSFRRARPKLFREGDYLPLPAAGKKKVNSCAFARRRGREWALVAVPRLLTRLVAPGQLPLGRKVWGTTTLALPGAAPARWLNLLTGEILEVSQAKRKKVLPLYRALQNFPVALLTAAPR